MGKRLNAILENDLKPYIKILSIFLLVTACNTRTATNEKIVFNKEEWQTGNRITKGKMADNIVSDSILIGRSKNNVIELLGQPDNSTDSCNRYYWIIDIGLNTGPLGIGDKWLFQLNVNFDSTHFQVDNVWISD